MAGKRKRYSADFKAKVALAAIRGEATIAELVGKHGVHQTLINAWKRQAIAGMAGVFSGKAEAAVAEREGEVGKLHAKIGQLVVQRDFLAKGEPAKAPPVRARWRADDERRPKARDDRAAASGPAGQSAVCPDRHQPRSASYWPAKGESPLNLALMRLIDAQFLETPWYGAGR